MILTKNLFPLVFFFFLSFLYATPPQLALPSVQQQAPSYGKEEITQFRAISEIFARKSLTTQEQRTSFLQQVQKFQKAYPHSRLNDLLENMVKSIFQIDLELYSRKGSVVLPKQKMKLVVAGKNINEVQFQLWKIPFRKLIEQGYRVDRPPLLKEQSQLQRSWSWKPPTKQNHWAHDIELAPLSPGAYILQGHTPRLQSQTFFLVSALALLAKQSKKQLFTWLPIHTSTDNNLSGLAELWLVRNDKIIHQTKAPVNDVWQAKITENPGPITIVAAYDSHIAVAQSSWFHYQNAQDTATLLADKIAYQPGETLHGIGILLPSSTPTKRQVKVQIQDKKWQTLYQQPFTPDKWGVFEFSYSLPKDLHQGEYHIRMFGGNYYASYTFLIEQPDATITKKRVATEKNKITWQLQFPDWMQQRPIHYRVWWLQERASFTPWLTWQDFSLAQPVIAHGKAVVAKNGQWRLSFSLPKGAGPGPFHAQVWLEKHPAVKASWTFPGPNKTPEQKLVELTLSSKQLQTKIAQKFLTRRTLVTWESDQVLEHAQLMPKNQQATFHHPRKQVQTQLKTVLSFFQDNGELITWEKKQLLPPQQKWLKISLKRASKQKWHIQMTNKEPANNTSYRFGVRILQLSEENSLEPQLAWDPAAFFYGTSQQVIVTSHSFHFEHQYEQEHSVAAEKGTPLLYPHAPIPLSMEKVPTTVLWHTGNFSDPEQASFSFVPQAQHHYQIFVWVIDPEGRIGTLEKDLAAEEK